MNLTKICKNFFDGVFSFPCIFIRKSLQKLLYSSDSFFLESFSGAVYEDGNMFGPQSTLNPNAGEIITLDNVKPYDDLDDSPIAAADDVYDVANTPR